MISISLLKIFKLKLLLALALPAYYFLPKKANAYYCKIYTYKTYCGYRSPYCYYCYSGTCCYAYNAYSKYKCCSSGYRCTSNGCISTYKSTYIYNDTGSFVGILLGAGAFLIFIVVLVICICVRRA